MYESMKNLVKPVFEKANIWENIRSLRNPRLAVRNYAYKLTKSKDEPPIPPQHLMDLVIEPPEAAWYLRSGKMAFASIKRTLEKNNIDLGCIEETLEFGCGTGRIMWYWKEKYNKNVCGTDYNKDLVSFCRQKRLEVKKNKLAPPLDYDGGQFDLVYANSVFTHLSEEIQKEWMEELRNKTKRAGYVYITLHGESRKNMMNEKERKKFDSGDIVVQKPNRSGTNICAAFHPKSYVMGEFSEGFDVVDHIERGARHANQDIYLLRKS